VPERLRSQHDGGRSNLAQQKARCARERGNQRRRTVGEDALQESGEPDNAFIAGRNQQATPVSERRTFQRGVDRRVVEHPRPSELSDAPDVGVVSARDPLDPKGGHTSPPVRSVKDALRL
jgi:hypothetical protein